MNDYAETVRLINVILCTAAFGGLMYRLVGRFLVTYPLARCVVGLFAALELIVALGTARRATLGGPLNEAQYFVMGHAVITLIVVVMWVRLIPENAPESR